MLEGLRQGRKRQAGKEGVQAPKISERGSRAFCLPVPLGGAPSVLTFILPLISRAPTVREIRAGEQRAPFSTQRSNLYLVAGHLGTVSLLQLQDLPLQGLIGPAPLKVLGPGISGRGIPKGPRGTRMGTGLS